MVGVDGGARAERDVPPLSLRVPARADYHASVRAAVQPYAREVAGSTDMAFVATLAVDEACTDLIERALDDPACLVVEASFGYDTVRFEVTLLGRAQPGSTARVREEMIKTISTRASFVRTELGERIEIDFGLPAAASGRPAERGPCELAQLYDLEEFRVRRSS
jgi:hypothetical protein